MWVIGKDENVLIDPHSSNILAKSGKSESKVVAEEEDGKAWTWESMYLHVSFKNSCTDKVSPAMLSLLLFKSHTIHENILSACVLVSGTLSLCARVRHTKILPCQPCQRQVLLLLGSPPMRIPQVL